MDLRILAYKANGEVVKDLLLMDVEEGLAFYAHQLLHVDDVVCVDGFDAGSGETLTCCDEGVDFADVKQEA